ncbi:MAG TPA: DNA-3-methyladenine glycosylase 2 family protein [Acetobacteraceae bacterium]|nr:DNA-3-methyladenine glycosylase 2 family protein [Acetobacteraceae bacterium]
MHTPLPPLVARAALQTLKESDPDLAAIERQAGPLPWRTRPRGFPGLFAAITGQQISNQAAAAIWGRVRALPGALEPAGLLVLPEEALRGAGLSRTKVAHARSLAAAFVEGRLDDARLAAMDDEAAVALLMTVRGLGRWTAEVYLLFALERADVFPAGDLALAAATAHLKRLPARPDQAVLRRLAERWRPHRALAARLLWHHWRHVTGRPSMDDVPGPPLPAPPPD